MISLLYQRFIVCLCVVFLCLSLPSQGFAEEGVRFNFKDADIRAVIKFVSAFTHKNYLIDNRVKGKVTIISPESVPRKAAYKVFLSVLEMNGFTIVEAGAITKILPLAEGRQKAIPLQTKGRPSMGDRLITRVVKVKNTNAQQLVAVLRPLLSPNSNLVAYASANMLLLTDSSSNVRRILDIIDVLDVGNTSGVKLMPLMYASADKLARILTGIFGAAGGRAKVAGAAGGVKILAYAPQNILVIVGPSSVAEEVAVVVHKLDKKPEHAAGNLHVRYLKNADAEAVAKLLGGISTDSAASAAGAKAAPVTGLKPLFSKEVKIVADPSTNALIITSDPSDWESINKIIDKLDIRRLQVFIEALVVEVRGSTTKQLGLEWLSGAPLGNGQVTVVGGQNFGTLKTMGAAVGGAAAAAGQTAAQAATVAAVGSLGGGLTAGLVKGQTLGGILRALESNGDTNIVSTPNILTMDNEEAEIIVGRNVPFVTGSSSTQAGVANPFTTIERKDVGLTLRVKPQISQGNSIRLEIFQEISSIDIAANTAGATDIITNKRSIKTVVLANDEETIVLGGLIRDDVTESVQKLPCLGSIPIAGEAFKFTDVQKQKTNLMVFLRPHIINNIEDIQTITQKKYLDIKGTYESQESEVSIIFKEERPDFESELDPKYDHGKKRVDSVMIEEKAKE
ncbi:MAG: type II secretion system secretin GspD [Mariprofundaceae bacterium]|nr:type II secretion system secretin GspD [Mariprofundaceae bacterium]